MLIFFLEYSISIYKNWELCNYFSHPINGDKFSLKVIWLHVSEAGPLLLLCGPDNAKSLLHYFSKYFL